MGLRQPGCRTRRPTSREMEFWFGTELVLQEKSISK